MQQRANAPDRFQPVENRRVALALQGGGSHGAFTWGVLDRLLAEPSLEIVGISGTSAGAGTFPDTGACGHWFRSARGTSTTILFTSGLTC